jgi:hypothetical protein
MKRVLDKLFNLTLFFAAIGAHAHTGAAVTGTEKPVAEKSTRFEKLPGLGSDCIALAEQKNLVGSERRSFIVECTREHIERSRTSPTPENAAVQAAHERLLDCQRRYVGEKGTAEWQKLMLQCMEPGRHSRKLGQ